METQIPSHEPPKNNKRESRPRRPRRSKADIEEAIRKSAVGQIKKRGFSLALVTDIVKNAHIEPIVFYNRYKNLNEFYDEFVKNYDYWLTDTIREMVTTVSSEEGYSNMIEKIFNALFNDDIMVELLRWEVTEGNNTTERTSRLRELHALEMISNYNSRHKAPEYDLAAITALIVGGIYYMMMHRNRSSMAGVNLNTPEGRHRVINAVRTLSRLLFRERENLRLSTEAANADIDKVEEYRHNFEKACRERVEADYRLHVEELMRVRQIAERERIARMLRTEGIDEEVIARVTR